MRPFITLTQYQRLLRTEIPDLEPGDIVTIDLIDYFWNGDIFVYNMDTEALSEAKRSDSA